MSIPIGPEERLMILDLYEKGKNFKEIAYSLGRDAKVIGKIVRRYNPTNQLAERLIRANAEKLAEMVIDKATPDQAIDILSRPNVGVLAPISNKGGFGAMFAVSVNQGDLGAVTQVTAAVGGVDAYSRSPLPNEGRGPLSLPGGQSGGDQEHEDGSHAHPGGVQDGPRSDQASPVLNRREKSRNGVQAQPDQEPQSFGPAEQPETFEPEGEEVQPWSLPTRLRTPAAGLKRTQSTRRNAAGQGGDVHVDKDRSRIAIRNDYKNPKYPRFDSHIHLRYDMNELSDE